MYSKTFKLVEMKEGKPILVGIVDCPPEAKSKLDDMTPEEIEEQIKSDWDKFNGS